MSEDDEDDDPQPDAYSTLYDPFPGIRERWAGRLTWWQKALLILGAFIAIIGLGLLATLRII